MPDHITSPHHTTRNSTRRVMYTVLTAMLPAIAVSLYYYGAAVLLQIIWCSAVAVAAESAVLLIRNRPLSPFLKDGSALLTAWLLALAIPPLTPWWLSTAGITFAIIIGKQLYGGLGYNPLNPAMLGYALMVVSFPQHMTLWLAPGNLTADTPGLTAIISAVLPIMQSPSMEIIDSWTMATPLELVQHNTTMTMDELWQTNEQLNGPGGRAWIMINIAWLTGGLILLRKKVIRWHAPVGMLATLTLMSLLFWGGTGSQSSGSPLFHLLSGATMMGAFFIITDPVSGATSDNGRLISGCIAGIFLYIIRAFGGYPDAMAFATLLMNFTAPMLDYYIKPKTMGYRPASRNEGK